MFTNKRSDKPQTECDTPTNIFVTGIGSPGGNNVYPTSVPNIGLRITNSSGKPFPYDDGGPWRSMSWSQSYAPRIQLIKTGNITAPGILAGAYARYTANNASGQTLVEYRFASPLVITPRVPTCKVDTPKILVSMRQKLASAMSFPGVGGIGPEENFEIRLSCSGGDAGTSTRPFVTLSDASTPGNRSTTLSLSAESSARGGGHSNSQGQCTAGIRSRLQRARHHQPMERRYGQARTGQPCDSPAGAIHTNRRTHNLRQCQGKRHLYPELPVAPQEKNVVVNPSRAVAAFFFGHRRR